MTKFVVITGAGSGVGRATAVLCAARGYDCALVGRSLAKLQETAAMMSTAPSAVIGADLGEAAGLDHVVEATRRLPRLDGLLNVAGVAPRAAVEATSAAVFRDCLAVNAVAAARLVAAHWSALQASRGCVVNVSSLAATDPFPGFLAYAASKAALESLTRSVHVEGFKDHGIRAFTIRLGAVETPMLRSLFGAATCPPDLALDPADVAAEIVACVEGHRDHRAGEAIELLREPPDTGPLKVTTLSPEPRVSAGSGSPV